MWCHRFQCLFILVLSFFLFHKPIISIALSSALEDILHLFQSAFDPSSEFSFQSLFLFCGVFLSSLSLNWGFHLVQMVIVCFLHIFLYVILFEIIILTPKHLNLPSDLCRDNFIWLFHLNGPYFLISLYLFFMIFVENWIFEYNNVSLKTILSSPLSPYFLGIIWRFCCFDFCKFFPNSAWDTTLRSLQNFSEPTFLPGHGRLPSQFFRSQRHLL